MTEQRKEQRDDTPAPSASDTAGPEVIYLQPECDAGSEGRTWCEDEIGACDCVDVDHPDTKYIRADIAARSSEKRVTRENDRTPDRRHHTSDAAPTVNDEMVHAAFNVLFYAPADYPREIGRYENGFAAMRRALEAALEKR